MYRGKIQTAGYDFLELGLVVGHTATRATQREGGANNHRVVAYHVLGDVPGLSHAVGHTAGRKVQTDAHHGILEALAVLAAVDGFGISTNHTHAVLLQRTILVQSHSAVQSRLATQGGQHGVRALTGNDFFHIFGRNRFHVSARSGFGVGHDGGRIGIHQHYLIAFLFQSLTGLSTGVVKLTPLTDNNGARANDENLLDRCVFRHGQCKLADICHISTQNARLICKKFGRKSKRYKRQRGLRALCRPEKSGSVAISVRWLRTPWCRTGGWP